MRFRLADGHYEQVKSNFFGMFHKFIGFVYSNNNGMWIKIGFYFGPG